MRCRTCSTPLTPSNASGLPKLCSGCREEQERRAVGRHRDNPLFLVGSAALAEMLAGEGTQGVGAFEGAA